MEYQTRLAVSAVSSLAMHITALSLCAIGGSAGLGSTGTAFEEPPLIIQLQRPQPDPVRRLVDSLVPAETPPEATDLIAEEDTSAGDLSPTEQDARAPDLEALAEFEEVAGDPAVAPSPANPRPAAHADILTAPEATPQELPQPTLPEPEPSDTSQQDGIETPFQMAKAAPQPLTEPGRTRARDDGDAKNRGFLSFEAMAHELAPYLQDVRKRVERRWRIALDLYYSGAAPTKAVLDCAISPTGRLVHVEIIDAGNSLNYAPLCKQAIEQAAPFPPFPFSVPEIYRNKNLEIRWTFSFL